MQHSTHDRAEKELILGSSSTFRKKVLQDAGYQLRIVKPGLDESLFSEQDPGTLALRLAAEKNRALQESVDHGVIVTADQVVVCEGSIRGKPESAAQAREYLVSYRTSPATTLSALYVFDCASGKHAAGLDKATIYLKGLEDKIIETILAEGTIFHCAGGFAVEHPLMAPHVQEVQGAFDSVLGMPIALLEKLLLEIGRQDLICK